MTPTVFIDGAVGTTGLEIADRLADRNDIVLATLDEARRKDPAARAEALDDADIVILCLPDDAAREAVALISNPRTRVIDASSAHRTDPSWAYGFPELSRETHERIASATRVSNPGCYPTGFLALTAPLIGAGLIGRQTLMSVNATSGYSGGGKAMIAAFEERQAPGATDTAFRLYALHGAHKHVGEMQVQAGLASPPLFAPAVARSYRGMLVEVPLQAAPPHAELQRALTDHYAGSNLIRVVDADEAAGLSVITLERLACTDRIDLFVLGNDASGQVRLVAALDNLGKGAAGAAVQNLNLMLGVDETTGLRL